MEKEKETRRRQWKKKWKENEEEIKRKLRGNFKKIMKGRLKTDIYRLEGGRRNKGESGENLQEQSTWLK